MKIQKIAAIIRQVKTHFQKKNRNEGLAREDDNPFFAPGGHGSGTYENFDACIAQGEHELKY